MPEAPGSFKDDLDAELATSRTGKCWYCQNVRGTEVDDAIRVKVAEGVTAWQAFARVLVKHGFPAVDRHKVSYHFTSGNRAKHGLV